MWFKRRTLTIRKHGTARMRESEMRRFDDVVVDMHARLEVYPDDWRPDDRPQRVLAGQQGKPAATREV